MLEVQHLKKRYGENIAVDDISFRVQKGQCFGLLGPNGAGKSTTISIMVGALKADSGKVLVEGAELMSETDPVRNRIGFVPQEIALYEELSALDNLGFFGSLYGGAPASRMEEVLDIVGLRDRAREPVRNFSGGMKRRLNIAVALVHSPDYLILDEPTVGVDPQSRNAIFDAVEEFLAQGITVLYTTHYMEEVERLCSQIAIVDHGRIVANDSLDGLLKLVPASQMTRFSFRNENDADRAKGTFATCNGLTTVVQVGTSVAVGAADLSEGLAIATAALHELSIPIDGVQTQRPTLEEVFLHCTGRSLRDQ